MKITLNKRDVFLILGQRFGKHILQLHETQANITIQSVTIVALEKDLKRFNDVSNTRSTSDEISCDTTDTFSRFSVMWSGKNCWQEFPQVLFGIVHENLRGLECNGN